MPSKAGHPSSTRGASVWFNAVLRADFAPIVVREGANVQDCYWSASSPTRNAICCIFATLATKRSVVSSPTAL